MQVSKKSLNTSGLIHLLVVYIVWGSTYLAIRVAVRAGSGYSPFMVGFTRAAAAAMILLVYAALTHQRLRLSRREMAILAGLGMLFWVGGNGLVMIGEQRADSGIAALVLAVVPIWVALIEALIDRKMPSRLQIGSLLLGLAGIIVLTMPLILSGLRADILAVAAIVAASVSWAGGTVLQSRTSLKLSPGVNSGYQLLFGSAGFGIMALITREPFPQPTIPAVLAVAYLVVFGSLLGFTSYLKSLKLLPTKIVTTHGYVNPIIAVILGALILKENVSHWTIMGALLVLVSVMGVFRDHARDHQNNDEIVPAIVEGKAAD